MTSKTNQYVRMKYYLYDDTETHHDVPRDDNPKIYIPEELKENYNSGSINTFVSNLKKQTPHIFTEKIIKNDTSINTKKIEKHQIKPEIIEKIEIQSIPENKEFLSNGDPKVWGPPFWFTLHNGAYNYPSLASPLFIERMKNFILAIPVMLPCIKCRDHATAYIERRRDELDLICNGKRNLFNFFVDFHNHVNERYGKKIYTYDEALALYDK